MNNAIDPIQTVAEPVLKGMYPDPSWIWDDVRGQAVLVNSSFELVPGLPIHGSDGEDLHHWKLLGHAVDGDMAKRLLLQYVEDSGGLYAPTLRKIGGTNGVYAIACTVARLNRVKAETDGVSADLLNEIEASQGNFVIVAERLEGPWSGPFWVAGAEGIDPDLFEDIDGTVWWTQTRPALDPQWKGQTEIWAQPIDPETWTLKNRHDGEASYGKTVLWRGYGVNAVWAEGPHLYRIGDWVYLMTAEGGTSFDHSEMMMRVCAPEGFGYALDAFLTEGNSASEKDRGKALAAIRRFAVGDVRSDERSVVGTHHRLFEANKKNPFLTHRHLGVSEPVQCVGHADLLRLPNGAWWLTCLGVREMPGKRPGELLSYLGRETFISPICWQRDPNDWKPSTGTEPESDKYSRDAGWPVLAGGLGRLPLAFRQGEDDGDDADVVLHIFPSCLSSFQADPVTISKAEGRRFVRVSAPDVRGVAEASHSLVVFQDSNNHATFEIGEDGAVLNAVVSGGHQCIRVANEKAASIVGMRLSGNKLKCYVAGGSSMDVDEIQAMFAGDPLISVDALFLSMEWSGGFVGCLMGV